MIIKKFINVGKNYINYIMKLGFKELFINFLELIMLVVLSLLILFPIESVKLLLLRILRLSGSAAEIFDICFLAIEIFGGLLFFIYMFNKRYEDINLIRNNRNNRIADTSENNEFARIEVEKEDLDLPKMADKKKF